MRVAAVIASLEAGGAERVMSTLANHWSAAGRDVTLITLSSSASDFYALDPGVRRVGLGLVAPSRNASAGLVRSSLRVLALRRALRDAAPDAVVSFGDATNVLTLAAGSLLRIPIVVSERTDPRFRNLAPAWRILRVRLYPRAAAVVVQTEAVRPWAESMVGRGVAHVIPNPVPPTVNPPDDAGPPREEARDVVAVGRLVPSKGFDVLLAAFASAAGENPRWRLTILGEGPERPRLERAARELAIAERVSLPGVVRDVGSVLRESDLFVLPSRLEGFPTALLEAMAHGLPVVSTDCRSGPAEIIRPGCDGLLVPVDDVEALAAAMSRVMGDAHLRAALGERAAEVQARFGVARVAGMWDELLTRGRAAISS